MKTYTTLSGTICLLLAFSTPCNATLISADLNIAGDGLLTLDDRTNLVWLDAPLSLNRSYNDLIGLDGSNEFAANGDFAGFRLASSDEVRSLFVDTLGIPLTDFAQWRPATYDKARLLHSFFGTTSGGNLAEIRAITTSVFDANSHWQSFARICQSSENSVCGNTNTANANVDGSRISDAASSHGTGAWIVRGGTESIPEPGILSLLGLGLAWIGVFRKRA